MLVWRNFFITQNQRIIILYVDFNLTLSYVRFHISFWYFHWSHNLIWTWRCCSCCLSWSRIAWRRASPSMSTTGLNSNISFSKTGSSRVSLSCYLCPAGERIVRFIPFTIILALRETQTTSFRIWTQVIDFTSYIENSYAVFLLLDWLRYLG